MGKRYLSVGAMALGTALFLFGCAANRGVVEIKTTPSKTAQTSDKEVLIRSVADVREFQDNPRTQDVPSLGFGGSSASSEEIKKRAIGRKRNTYGKAMGDILLTEGQTVESVINDTLKRAFGELGYRVLNSEQEVSPNTTVIDASIRKLWAYMTPGFWALTLTSDISTELKVRAPKTGVDKMETITVKAEGKFQTGAEGNWMEVIHQGLDKYVEQIKAKFSGKY